MKKVIAIVICLLLTLSLVGCGENVHRVKKAEGESDIHYCDCCGNETLDVKESSKGYYCYGCIINSEYEKCCECGLYYENDGLGSNEVYCHNCFEDKGKICFLCGQSFGDMISLEIEDECYFICPDCASDYFENIKPIMPVGYCIECGHLYPLGDYYYEHYIIDGDSICEECLIMCSQ